MGTAPTATEPVASQSLGKTFITALLLTGSMDRAEAAVLAGIERLDPVGASDEALLRESVNASIQARNESPSVAEELAAASSILPLELRRVLQLSANLRYCFVLRLLVGYSRELCARLLGSEVPRIDQLTCLAMQSLAE